MNQRTTVIIGAGAVLDFNYDDITFPSTANITDTISKLEIEGLYDKESKVISTIFSKINKIIGNSNKNTDHGSRIFDPRAIPLYGHFLELQQYIDFPNIEYERALIYIIRTVADIINQYNQKFKENILYESWYRHFWSKRVKEWDIFTLNYDTTIENSLIEYEDGFESVLNTNYEHFIKNYRRSIIYMDVLIMQN